MTLYAKEPHAEWTPITDDQFRVQLIDADMHRPVAVAIPNILMDHVDWEFRRQRVCTAALADETRVTTVSMEELEQLLKEVQAMAGHRAGKNSG